MGTKRFARIYLVDGIVLFVERNLIAVVWFGWNLILSDGRPYIVVAIVKLYGDFIVRNVERTLEYVVEEGFCFVAAKRLVHPLAIARWAEREGRVVG